MNAGLCCRGCWLSDSWPRNAEVAPAEGELVAKMGWAWPNDFSAGQVKLIGLVESLGAGRSRKFGGRSDSKRTRRT
jgi:hypothetical protein